MNRRTFVVRTAVSLAASAIGCFGYATEIEPHWLEIVQRDLPVEQLPKILDGARLMQLSDLHVGPQVSDEVDDLWAHRGDPPAALASRQSAKAIVLVHNPDAADQQQWPGFRGWMLAGHTHGGQCKPPFLPPPLLPVQNRRYIAGEVPVTVDAGRTLYISRGVGHLIRARFLVRPEITLFTLRAATAAA